jgi:hypothetical protein
VRGLAVWVVPWMIFGCCSVGGRLEPRPASEYRARIAVLGQRAPIGSTALAAPPFVVIGDGAPEDVRAVTEDVVEWSVRRLKADFFSRDPDKIIEIWMFRDSDSYLQNTSALFSTNPSTPYGYYSACDRAVVVNLGLGAGTLVHEIVHVFIQANFPEAPTWLNEGLASLFEQPAEAEGHIRGKINWRLPGLKEAILRGRSVDLVAVMSASRSAFYAEPGVGQHYAVARYLLYYLQARNLLIAYYRHFVLHHPADPTGIRSLLEVLGERNIETVQTKWERFVTQLEFSRASGAAAATSQPGAGSAWHRTAEPGELGSQARPPPR